MLSVLVIYQAGLHASKHEGVVDILTPLQVHLSTCSLAEDASALGQPLEQEIEALLAQTDHIVIAGASLTLLKQLDELDDSSPLAAIILYGLAIGIRVQAVRETIDPRTYLTPKGMPSFHINKRLDQRLQTIQTLGIDILSLHELQQRYAAPHHTCQGIVTLKDVQTAWTRGAVEQLQGHFTPAAQDWLHEQGLSRHLLGNAS